MKNRTENARFIRLHHFVRTRTQDSRIWGLYLRHRIYSVTQQNSPGSVIIIFSCFEYSRLYPYSDLGPTIQMAENI